MDPLCQYQELVLFVKMDQPGQELQEVVRFHVKEIDGVMVYLVEAERYREKRNVYTYTPEEEAIMPWKKNAHGHVDYFAMNVLLQKATLDLLMALDRRPDIIHCHDGHTALLPALIRETPGYSAYFRGSASVVTIHNAGRGYHQEISDLPFAAAITGLPRRVIEANRLEEKFDPFIAASNYAMMNTVSENYARELMETDSDYLTGWLGHSLKMRNIRLYGITNGIDPEVYDPGNIKGGPEFSYDPGDMDDDLSGKRRCREELLTRLERGLGGDILQQHGSLECDDDSTIFTFVGRINSDKGVDTLLAVIPAVLQRYPECRILLLGDGDRTIVEQLISHAELPEFAGRFCFLEGYDAGISTMIYAAGDFFMIPSRFEPCGLTDFISQLYGNIPVVRHVGGLVKVKDGETGLAYTGVAVEALLEALERALLLTPEDRRRIQYQAVQEIRSRYTWSRVMQRYVDFYTASRRKQVACTRK